MPHSKRRMFIIGAGGFGREMESALDSVDPAGRDWELFGYLDRDETALDGYPTDYRVVGEPFSFDYEEGDLVVIAIANPDTKRKLVDHLTGKVEFYTYVAPWVELAKYSALGRGVIIHNFVRIANNAKIGDFVIINGGTMIGHDSVVGDYCSLMANVDLGGQCTLGEGVYIGTNATIVPGKKIADEVAISAGAIVIKSIRKACTVFGNPAVKVKM